MHDKLDATLSYFASFLGFCSDLNWMGIGAAVLLVARLIVDVPKAYFYVRNLRYGKTK